MEGRRRVLILDFDERLLMTLERVLEDSGFSATTTWDVGEGRALMQRNCFDFLVIGNRPPDLDAQEFIADRRRQGLSFDYFVLGSPGQHHRDGYDNLIDRLRSSPCRPHLVKTAQTKESAGPHGTVHDGRWVRKSEKLG